MSEVYMMVTITDRKQSPRFLDFYQKNQVETGTVTLGKGTANNEILDYLGLEDAEKAVLIHVVTDSVWKKLKKGLERELQIDIPGTGIAFLVPLCSIGGKRELLFLTENQNFEKGEETELKGTNHELIVVIANQGYNEMVMDAAREAGAAGGTLIHAKGVGMKRAEKFLGVSLASEKELILIVTKTDQKREIMRAIMKEAGMDSKAKSIVFSLPVTSTAGLRLIEDDLGEETEK
mgnify:CR=1 FL=1